MALTLCHPRHICRYCSARRSTSQSPYNTSPKIHTNSNTAIAPTTPLFPMTRATLRRETFWISVDRAQSRKSAGGGIQRRTNSSEMKVVKASSSPSLGESWPVLYFKSCNNVKMVLMSLRQDASEQPHSIANRISTCRSHKPPTTSIAHDQHASTIAVAFALPRA